MFQIMKLTNETLQLPREKKKKAAVLFLCCISLIVLTIYNKSEPKYRLHCTRGRIRGVGVGGVGGGGWGS